MPHHNVPTPSSTPRRAPHRPRGRACAALVGVLAFGWLALAAQPATAQERVTFEVTPDDSLARVTGGRPLAWAVAAGLGAASGFPAQGPNTVRGEAYIQALAGLRATNTTHLTAATNLMLPVATPYDGGADTSFSAAGDHRLRAAAGIVTSSGGKDGFDVEIFARVQHQGDEQLGIRHPSVGSEAFVETDLSLTFAPKFDPFGGDGVMLFPVSYTFESIHWPDAPPGLTDGPTVHGVRGAWAFAPRSREWREGMVRLFDFHYRHVGFERADVPRNEREFGFHVFDGRLIDFDGVIFDLDGALMGVALSLGGAGFSRDTGGPQGGTFVFELGAHGHHREASFGLMVGRDVAWSATGDRPLGDNRVEVDLAFTPPDDGGFRIRAALGWIDDLGEDVDEATLRFASYAELYWDLVEGMQAGIFYDARRGMFLDETTWDPWTASLRWTQDVGLFVRWRGEGRD